MVSPSRLAASSATKKTGSPQSVGSCSKQPAASDAPVSNYRLGTAATIAPNVGTTLRSLGDEAPLQSPPAHVTLERISSSEDKKHNNPDPPHSGSSATPTLVDGDSNSESASSSNKVTNPSGVPPRPKARASKKTLGKRPRADSTATSTGSNKAAVAPAKKRVRTSALMRSAPRATSTTTPGGLAGNSEFMYVHPSFLLPIIQN